MARFNTTRRVARLAKGQGLLYRTTCVRTSHVSVNCLSVCITFHKGDKHEFSNWCAYPDVFCNNAFVPQHHKYHISQAVLSGGTPSLWIHFASLRKTLLRENDQS